MHMELITKNHAATAAAGCFYKWDSLSGWLFFSSRIWGQVLTQAVKRLGTLYALLSSTADLKPRHHTRCLFPLESTHLGGKTLFLFSMSSLWSNYNINAPFHNIPVREGATLRHSKSPPADLLSIAGYAWHWVACFDWLAFDVYVNSLANDFK